MAAPEVVVVVVALLVEEDDGVYWAGRRGAVGAC